MPNPNIRGTGDIIFTCLATISLCVYTVLHLNVPKRGSTTWDNVLRKAKWVLVGLFAPEIVVYSAFVQLQTVIVFTVSMRKILQGKVEEHTFPPTKYTKVPEKDHEATTMEEKTAQESDPMMKYMVKGRSTVSALSFI